tara:strand:+ start:196 stop:825 length:630 start_codon:yes stop_codon:yes gene_type:complete
MLKLKELLEMDKMVYSDFIKPKHAKKMKRELKHIHYPQIPHNPPPSNSSKKTIEELHWLNNYNNGAINEFVVKEGDDGKEVWKGFFESKGLEFPKEYYKELIKDSGRIIYELKYKYNRPRPKQLADYLQIEGFSTTTLDSMKTPSYPSGHSVQGIFISRVFSKMLPEHTKELLELGKMISESRLMARAHYPSDSKFGEQVGEILFLNLK